MQALFITFCHTLTYSELQDQDVILGHCFSSSLTQYICRCHGIFCKFWKDTALLCVSVLELHSCLCSCSTKFNLNLLYVWCQTVYKKPNMIEMSSLHVNLSSLTREAELADSFKCVAEKCGPGNCRWPCISHRPFNKVIWFTVFRAICLGLMWSGSMRAHHDWGVRSPLVVYAGLIRKPWLVNDLWTQ